MAKSFLLCTLKIQVQCKAETYSLCNVYLQYNYSSLLPIQPVACPEASGQEQSLRCLFSITASELLGCRLLGKKLPREFQKVVWERNALGWLLAWVFTKYPGTALKKRNIKSRISRDFRTEGLYFYVYVYYTKHEDFS